MTEEEIKLQAAEYARQNKKRLAKELTDLTKYVPDSTPVSAFMAGSPGAGKTEFSKQFVASIVGQGLYHDVLRIDGDELRHLLPNYNGMNSYLFQGAVSILIDKIHDTALEQSQSFILDGTFSKFEKAVSNINRSILKGRIPIIFYIYQSPEIAWQFTQSREIKEGRHIPKEAFIREFLEAKETVKRISDYFGIKLTIFLVKKNFKTHQVEEIIRINSSSDIDDSIENTYTKESLEKLL